MKKLCMWLLVLILPLMAISCKSQVVSYKEKKTSNYAYTKELLSKIDNKDISSVYLFETNLHKQIDVSKEASDVIKNFIKDLKSTNFIDKPNDFNLAPKYKLFVSVNNEKYVINVYNETLVSIHPWDGVHEMDFIDSSGTHKAYNLNGLCNYILKR